MKFEHDCYNNFYFFKNLSHLAKENVVPIHYGILRSLKNELMSFSGTWVELEAIILSQVTQGQKTKCHMLSLVSGS